MSHPYSNSAGYIYANEYRTPPGSARLNDRPPQPPHAKKQSYDYPRRHHQLDFGLRAGVEPDDAGDLALPNNVRLGQTHRRRTTRQVFNSPSTVTTSLALSPSSQASSLPSHSTHSYSHSHSSSNQPVLYTQTHPHPHPHPHPHNYVENTVDPFAHHSRSHSYHHPKPPDQKLKLNLKFPSKFKLTLPNPFRLRRTSPSPTWISSPNTLYPFSSPRGGGSGPGVNHTTTTNNDDDPSRSNWRWSTLSQQNNSKSSRLSRWLSVSTTNTTSLNHNNPIKHSTSKAKVLFTRSKSPIRSATIANPQRLHHHQKKHEGENDEKGKRNNKSLRFAEDPVGAGRKEIPFSMVAV